MTTSLGPGLAGGVAEHVRTGDPCERLDFASSISGPLLRFDTRSESELRTGAFDRDRPLERERALWELAERNVTDIAGVIADYLAAETHRGARHHAVWLLVQTLGREAVPHLRRLAAADDDPDLVDWARVYLNDLVGEDHRSVYSTAEITGTGAFDQTLPLIISGYVVTEVPSIGSVEVRLSPLWFESIMGRVMACTNQATIRTDLVIEKAIRAAHPDGSDHYELFKFRGMSGDLGEHAMEHHYVSCMDRAFYPSGIVEDGPSMGDSIYVQRVANTLFSAPGEFDIAGDGARASRMAREPMPFVKSVRGRYFGFAAVHLASVLASGTVGHFQVQLSNPTGRVSGPMTNARLYGLFRGKLSDHAGNGNASVNLVPCHGTVDGEHDLHRDGTKVADPFLG